MNAYSVASLRNLVDISSRSRLKVGFDWSNPTNREICEALPGLRFNDFWKNAFDYYTPSSIEPLFDTYHPPRILNLALLSPADIGLYSSLDDANHIEFSKFLEYALDNYPELGLLKPEAIFRIGNSYPINIGENHFVAIDPVLMRKYDYRIKAFTNSHIMGRVRIFGIPHKSNPNVAYPLKVQSSESNLRIGLRTPCLFEYKGDDRYVISGEDELREFSMLSAEEWIDMSFDEVEASISPNRFNQLYARY